jgi:hypothetical protein
MVGFSGDGESYFSLVVENEKGYFLLYVIIKEEVTLIWKVFQLELSTNFQYLRFV